MESLTIGDLFRQPWFQDAECLTGTSGLERMVTWFYLMDDNDMPKNIDAGELLLLSWPSDLVGPVVEQCAARGAAGLLLFAREHGPAIPDSLLNRAKEMQIPVLFISRRGTTWGDLIHDLSLCIAKSVSEQDRLRDAMIALMTGKTADPEELRRKTLRSGYNFEVNHQALCLGFNAGSEGVEAEMRRTLEGVCRECLSRYYPIYPSVFTNGKLLVLLPENHSAPPIQELGETLLSALRARFPQVTFHIGIGKQYRKLEGFSDSIYESELTSRALRSLGRDNQVGVAWEMMPFVILLAVRDRKQLYALQDPVLNQLTRSNAELDLNLLQTLETYLDCDKNGKLAAEKLFIHRNTLKMRLDRIEALTGRSLSNPEHCFLLRFALYVRHFIAHG